MLKAVFAAALVSVCWVPAGAAELVVGIVRDQDGVLVSGATVRAAGADGRTLASDRTSADGTFALEPPTTPATLEVDCRYCRPLRLVPPARGPVVVEVRRSTILRDRGLSPEDVRALPYPAAVDVAGLEPLSVRTRGAISDRGLARMHGNTVVDGLPAYRSLDGLDLSSLLPAHAPGALEMIGPTNAATGRATGGTFAFTTLDIEAEQLRVQSGSPRTAQLRIGGPLRFSLANGIAGDDAARAAAVATTFGSAQTRVRVSASSAGTYEAGFAGGALTLEQQLGAARLAASYTAVRSNAVAGVEADTLGALVVRAGSLSAGVRTLRTATAGSTFGTASDVRAFVAYDRTTQPLAVHLSLAAARASGSVGGIGYRRGALLPAAALDWNLSPRFALRVGMTEGITDPAFIELRGVNRFVPDRTTLLESAVRYDDGRALRVELQAFRQPSDGTRPAVIGGSGVSVSWQLAPDVALRAWALIAGQTGEYAPTAPGPYRPLPNAPILDNRSVMWLTLGRRVRFDVIDRGGALDGDVVLPVGDRLSLVAGTYWTGTTRAASVGVSLR